MEIDDCVSDKEIAQKLGPEYMSPCSQLTFVADIRIAKKKLLELRKKESILELLKNNL